MRISSWGHYLCKSRGARDVQVCKDLQASHRGWTNQRAGRSGRLGRGEERIWGGARTWTCRARIFSQKRRLKGHCLPNSSHWRTTFRIPVLFPIYLYTIIVELFFFLLLLPSVLAFVSCISGLYCWMDIFYKCDVFVMDCHFCHYKISFYVSSSNFILMYILSDYSVSSPAFFCLLITWYIFHPFIVNLLHLLI